MLHRTVGTLGRSTATSPLSPALLKLEPEKRVRLIKSSQKVSRVLGATPVIDIQSPTSGTSSSAIPSSTIYASHVPPVGAGKSLLSPATFFHSVVPKSPAPREMVESPVLRYRIPANGTSVDSPVTTTANRRVTSQRIRRKHVPTALPIAEAPRTEAMPLSPLRYSVLSPTGVSTLSPFSSRLSLSPITVAKVEEGKRAKLEKLERLAQYATIGVPQELVYPSFGQVEENAEQITSFLDLYHLHSLDDAKLSNKRSAAQREVLSGCGLLSPNGGDGTSWRLSRASYSGKRRSRSVEGLYTLDDASEIASPRRSAGLRPLQSPSYPARPTTIMSAFTIPEYLISPSIYSEASADRDVHFDVPIIAPQHSPGKLERKRSIARARQSIVGADAKLMSRFRTEFGTRPLEFPLPPFPAPTGPLPSPPTSPLFQDVRSPRTPYWVKRSLRPRSPAQAQQHLTVAQESFINSKRSSRDSVHWATPRTRRFERRMGWGGRWNQGSMAGVIESLKEL